MFEIWSKQSAHTASTTTVLLMLLVVVKTWVLTAVITCLYKYNLTAINWQYSFENWKEMNVQQSTHCAVAFQIFFSAFSLTMGSHANEITSNMSCENGKSGCNKWHAFSCPPDV
jgi:hypothetical protein